jgi:hypothetical protein
MRKLFTLIFLMLIVSASMAQEGKSEMPFTLKGKKALSFSFNGFNLGEFYGGVGGKMWLSNSVALFASVDMNYATSGLDKSDQRNGSKSSNFTTGLNAGMIKTLSSNKRFLPYLGFNLGLDYSKSTTEPDNVNGFNTKTESGMFNIDLGAALGVESFITDGISLSAQHVFGLGFGFGTYKQTTEQPNQPNQVYEQNQSSFNFGLGTSSLILSVYF